MTIWNKKTEFDHLAGLVPACLPTKAGIPSFVLLMRRPLNGVRGSSCFFILNDADTLENNQNPFSTTLIGIFFAETNISWMTVYKYIEVSKLVRLY